MCVKHGNSGLHKKSKLVLLCKHVVHNNKVPPIDTVAVGKWWGAEAEPFKNLEN